MSCRVLCCVAALCLAVAAISASPASRPARSTSNSWLQLITEYARNNLEFGDNGPQWTLPGVSRPAAKANPDPQPGILPLLVLPMPVSSSDTQRTECPVSTENYNNYNQQKLQGQYQFPSGHYPYPNMQYPHPAGQYPLPTGQYQPPAGQYPLLPGQYPLPSGQYPFSSDFNTMSEAYPPKKTKPPMQDQYTERPDSTPEEFTPEVDSTVEPKFDKTVTSQKLVEMFRAQMPSAPFEPPIKQSQFDGSDRSPLPLLSAAASQRVRRQFSQFRAANPAGTSSSTSSVSRSRTPARPRFDRPLLIRGQLTVPRAAYSESYTVWWDPESGGARLDYHDGSASTFRSLSDGNVYRSESHVDRSGDRSVRRCAVGTPQRATPVDSALPVLPMELDQFSFAGFVESRRGGAELWRRDVVGRTGELGGARGEALSSRHELLLVRDHERVVPLSYTVSVNSSVLGPDCDGHYHEFFEVMEQQHMPSIFNLDLDEACDQVEYVNASSPDQLARLEPLREFILPRRDPRYDTKLQEFITEHDRSYTDNTEQAVRKNIIMQSHRFVSSGNREGATAELGVNFLSDRLDGELQDLQGVALSEEMRRAERFPHSRRQLTAAEGELPRQFDWRRRGGVSPVRYQGQCSSCWAFAVAGAVEGALFRIKGRLVPLSEKHLVDCAHSHGGNGCMGTWPSHAYDYINDRGLPALEEYTPYEPKVDQCAKASPVTRISGHVNVTQNSVPALKIAIMQHAPTVVIVDANAKSFINYKKGVLYDDRCAKNLRRLKHAVLAVGWGEKRGEPYFILKNSWSSKWGDGGYIRVQARANTCGVLTMPSYPRLEGEDVLRDLPAAPQADQPAK